MADDDFMLTTVDNPYDPFTEWDAWFAWDFRAGYHTPGALARQAFMSNELSEADQAVAIQQAIVELCDENVTGVYKKVARKDAKVS